SWQWRPSSPYCLLTLDSLPNRPVRVNPEALQAEPQRARKVGVAAVNAAVEEAAVEVVDEAQMPISLRLGPPHRLAMANRISAATGPIRTLRTWRDNVARMS